MHTRVSRIGLLLLGLFGSFWWLTLSIALAKPTLKISAIPDQNPERLSRLYNLLSLYLSSQLSVPVRYIPVTNYPAAVSAFRTRSLDVVWFGGLTGVQARLQRPGALVLAQRDIDKSFRSVFIANIDSGLEPVDSQSGLSVLKGRRFTFGSESSTSGRLMPQFFLAEVGVLPSDFAGGYAGFSGSHDATIALVQSGSYEAGALNEQVWQAAIASGRAKPTEVIVLWRSRPYADYHWLAQPDLDRRFGSNFTKRLQQALFSLSSTKPEHALILSLFGAKRFIPANESQYNAIEEIGRQLGKVK